MSHQLRNAVSRTGIDSELFVGVVGSASLCAKLYKDLENYQESAVLSSAHLMYLEKEFRLMCTAFTVTAVVFQKQQSLWTRSAFTTIERAQDQCRKAASFFEGLDLKNNPVSVLPSEPLYRELHTLSKCVHEQRISLRLLAGVFDLIKTMDNSQEGPNARDVAWYQKRSLAVAEVRDLLKLQQASYRELCKDLPKSDSCQDNTAGVQPEKLSDDLSTTHSTTGVSTPAEDWSDIGSDMTKTDHASEIAVDNLEFCEGLIETMKNKITKLQTFACDSDPVSAERREALHRLIDEFVFEVLHVLKAPVPFQNHDDTDSEHDSESDSESVPEHILTELDLEHCLDAITDFERVVEEIQEQPDQGNCWVLVKPHNIEYLHDSYCKLVFCLLVWAPAPFQKGCPFSDPDQARKPRAVEECPPRPAWAAKKYPGMEHKEVVESASSESIDQGLQKIIELMSSDPTYEDVTKLVFFWTSLDEFNGIKREDVM
ncbi:hypothetical protein D6C90_07843 [Aureobasidium pullulans]|uniref:Uncharacterized protein n=1 Tax=Aureobasidium pullulans TaxID=5580 RepID=A0A4S9U851_AURPU|nr:hypothetical protein D6D08_07717 [Aureobasidium pullulans]THZ34224.1 hypothetical protein D6C90_07843 [Aureobasidium pullulans]